MSDPYYNSETNRLEPQTEDELIDFLYQLKNYYWFDESLLPRNYLNEDRY